MVVFLLIAVLAGVFTVLAPCILPLLPIVIGASEENERGVSKRAMVVIGSLSVSVITFTLLLKFTTTVFTNIPQEFWNAFSGSVLILVGLAIAFPSIWTKIPLIQKMNALSNRAVGSGYQKKSYKGDLLIGLSLGPVFTTCSPTYLFIIGTVLPASFLTGLVYLAGFTFGLAVSLICIAYFGQKVVNKISAHMETTGKVKQFFGVLIAIVGLTILTGYDKVLQTKILDSGYGATIQLEDSLIEKFAPPKENSIQKP